MNTGTPYVAKRLVSDKASKSPLTPCRRVGLGRPSPSSASLKRIRTFTTPSSTCKNNKSEKLHTLENNENIETEQLTCYTDGVSGDTPKTPSSSSDAFNKESPLTRGNLRLSRTNSNRVNLKRSLCNSNSNSSNNTADSLSTFSPSKSALSSQKTNTKKQKNWSDQSFNVEHVSDPSPIVDLPESRLADDTLSVTSDSRLSNNDDINVTFEMIQKLVLLIKEKNNRLELMKVQQTYSKKHNLEELRSQTAKWRLAGQEALRYAASLANTALPGSGSDAIKQLIHQHGFSPDLIRYNEEDEDFY